MELADRIERRLKLHDLRVLMTVVQAGSMGKAAKQLGTSQLSFQEPSQIWNTCSACLYLIV